MMSGIKVNEIIHGEVVSVQPYGVFVKIPNCKQNGLVHKSQISKTSVDDVSEVLAVGDKVWCKVMSLGESELKISLSMKFVEQGSGKDLDPNGVELMQDEKRKKEFKPRVKQKVTLEAVYNTTCKKCGTKGHLAQDCFHQPGSKVYDLLPDDEEAERTRATDIRQTDEATKSSHKRSKHKKSKKKHKRSRDSSSDSSSQKVSKKKKRKKHT